MKITVGTSLAPRIHLRMASIFPGFFVSSMVGSCATTTRVDGEKYQTDALPFRGDPIAKKSIFVFFDGTANHAGSETNVWKLYRFIVDNNDPQATAFYVAGVGSADSAPLPEAALGHGMEPRILDGYGFIARNYSPGDGVYIFGFSRGAHQARALAGFISYAGIIANPDAGEDSIRTNANRIIELVKKKRDTDFSEMWTSWSPGDVPPLAKEIDDKLGIKVVPTGIDFLGIWDTVPGSSLKNYQVCKEKVGFIKRWFYWLIPGIDKGERYKSDSYPPIRYVAHAVSLDEKRSKFAPLMACPPINGRFTVINEVWFPGAHADVGGGYEGSSDLPHISLKWMIGLLNRVYPFKLYPKVAGNAAGLAHWSIGDSPANKLSHCQDREPPEGATIHVSFDNRMKASPVKIRWKGEQREMDYPVDCSKN